MGGPKLKKSTKKKKEKKTKGGKWKEEGDGRTSGQPVSGEKSVRVAAGAEGGKGLLPLRTFKGGEGEKRQPRGTFSR